MAAEPTAAPTTEVVVCTAQRTLRSIRIDNGRYMVDDQYLVERDQAGKWQWREPRTGNHGTTMSHKAGAMEELRRHLVMTNPSVADVHANPALFPGLAERMRGSK